MVRSQPSGLRLELEGPHPPGGSNQDIFSNQRLPARLRTPSLKENPGNKGSKMATHGIFVGFWGFHLKILAEKPQSNGFGFFLPGFGYLLTTPSACPPSSFHENLALRKLVVPHLKGFCLFCEWPLEILNMQTWPPDFDRGPSQAPGGVGGAKNHRQPDQPPWTPPPNLRRLPSLGSCPPGGRCLGNGGPKQPPPIP